MMTGGMKLAGARWISRRAPLVSISRPVSRVLSARAKRPRVTAIPLRRRLPGALSNLPGRPDPDMDPGDRSARAAKPRAVPIRSCSRWGLPCRLRCRRRGALLPHRFTLTAPSQLRLRRSVTETAVCSLWHFPWVFTPAGRYPAPYVHGARTFLSDHLSALARATVQPTDS